MEKIKLNIFKANDIRGIYPQELNSEVAYKVAKVFTVLTGSKTTAVARDMRLGGEDLFLGLTNGLREAGNKVIDLGLVPTEGIYFSVGHYKYDAGIMITASHNPKEYNGLKMVTRDEKGINVVRGTAIKEGLLKEILGQSKKAGILEKKDIWPDYLSHIFSFIDKNKLKPLKIVVDAGNGLAGKVIPMIETRLPEKIKIIKMNFNLDGNFPAHPSNPLELASRAPLQKKVVKEKAAVGFIFDGDADRIFLVDEKGNFLRGDTTLLLLAKYFLDNKLGNIFVYNVICSKAVPEIIQKMGGVALREKVGYVNLSTRMKKEGGVLSGEVSGHYSFAENFYADSGFITFLMVLQLLSESSCSLSELSGNFNPYCRGDEVSIQTEDAAGQVAKVRQTYQNYQQDELDGITVDAWQKEGWWFNVRASNTEPLLRITVEGKTKLLMEKKIREITRIIATA